MSAMTEVAKENMRVQQDRQKYYYDKKSRMRSYSVGDTVLMLLPSDSSKLKVLWKGSFTIIRKLYDVDYEIRVGGNKGVQSYHVNMLRKWEERHTTLFRVEEFSVWKKKQQSLIVLMIYLAFQPKSFRQRRGKMST